MLLAVQLAPHGRTRSSSNLDRRSASSLQCRRDTQLTGCATQFERTRTLASVAPGIAEALIATAIGLFAAIPAVIGYNRYTHDLDRLATRYETFIEEFSNILQRQA